MFINSDNINNGQDHDHGRAVLSFIGFAVILLIIIVGIFFAIKFISLSLLKDKPDKIVSTSTVTTTAGLSGFVSSGDMDDADDKEKKSAYGEVANLFFGNFYDVQRYDDIDFSFEDYVLPLNAKIDVSNYYDINRKIGLDDVSDELNSNGFTILPDTFSRYGADFYTMFENLQKDEIPLLITTDFLNYYYQNILQESYKMTENELFFSSLWNVGKALYEESKTRYENLYRENKMVNNPFLEASRLETAYLAVILKLLSPTENQINNMKLSEENSFTEEDAKGFSISLPTYLQVDVEREVDLILNHKKIKEEKRSPVLKYYRDYDYFNVPDAYRGNIRLNNFYLASQWIHSIFPLCYRSEQCEDCLLDKADWRISFLTSLLISQDFAANQANKNEWAQIYKFFSFFNGLRKNLVYIDMDTTMKKIIGEDYDLKSEFLNMEIQRVDSRISEIQASLISNFKKNDIRGHYDYNSTSSRMKIGMRILSESYSPNEYFYKQFNYPSTGVYLGLKKEAKLYRTNCGYNRKNSIKCLGSDLDMLNLFKEVDDRQFLNSMNYEFYDEKVVESKLWLDEFDNYAWHDNNYWATLYSYKAYLENSMENMPAFMRQNAWDSRVSDFVLGSLVYVQAEDIDKLKTNRFSLSAIGQDGFSKDSKSIRYAYVEPNLVFIREMSANLKMLRDIFLEMGISVKVDSVKKSLDEAVSFFDNIVEISEKELKGKELNDEDYDFLYEFVNRYELVERGDSVIKSDHALTRSLDRVKLLLLIYNKNGKKILAGGPVYNYKEGK